VKVIVFVPGIMGSTLLLPDNTAVWPPTIWEATAGGYQRIAELILPDLRVGEVIGSVCIDFYGSLLKHLAAVAAAIGGVFVPHPYDWRRDLVGLGAELGAELDRLVAQFGDDTEISVICHSMGGLLTRGWLERPEAASSPGRRATRLVVFLAVPHDGAPLAFSRAIGASGGSVGLSAADLRRLSGAAGFPAAYQLFPPARLRPVWQLDRATPFEDMSLFDPSLAASQGLKATHLAAAEAFGALLDIGRKPPSCRYFTVASATHETMTRFDLRTGTISPVLVAGAGDGTVPIRSAAALPVQTAYVDADHVGVAQHANTHTLLSMLLGAKQQGPVAAFADADAPALSISPKFATIGEDTEIVVMPGRTAPFAAVVAIEAEQADGAFHAIETVPVTAASPGLKTIVIRGPAVPPGRYRLRLLKDGVVLAATDFVMMRRSPG
jgi:hypothetical protein